MAELAQALKAIRSYLDKGDEYLKYVSPETDAMLRGQKYAPLFDDTPGMQESAGHMFHPGSQQWMHEIVTGTPGVPKHNAVALVSPDEFFQTFGRPDPSDPAVRRQVRRLAHEATQGDGINEIVILDGARVDKSLNIERVQGSEIMAALAEIDPKAKVPVILRALNMDWAGDFDAPTALLYQGKQSPMFRVPQHEAQVARGASDDTIIDGRSPLFYLRQAQTPEQYREKLVSLLEPSNARFHMDGAGGAGTMGPNAIEGWRNWAIRADVRPTAFEVEAAKAAYKEELDLQQGLLAGMYRNENFAERVQQFLSGTPYTRALYGETGASKDAPLVFFRGVKQQTQTADPSSLGRSIESPQEFGAHFGTNQTAHHFVVDKKEIDVALIAAKNHLTNLLEGKPLAYFRPNIEAALKAAILQAPKPLPGQRVGEITPAILKQELEFQLGGSVKEGANLLPIARHLALATNRATGSAISAQLFTGKRGLMLYDQGGFFTDRVANQLRAIPEFQPHENALVRIAEEAEGARQVDDRETYAAMTQQLQRLIESKGYDHISYLNNYETPQIEGHKIPTLSIISWKNDQFISPYSPRLHGVENQNRLLRDVVLSVLAALGLEQTIESKGPSQRNTTKSDS